MTSVGTEYQARLQGLQALLTDAQCDLCIIDQPLDLLYYTGLELSAGSLLVNEKQAVLFVDGRYIQAAQEEAPMEAMPDDALVKWVSNMPSKQRCAFNPEKTSHAKFLRLSSLFDLVGAEPMYQRLRSIKDGDEQEKMRKSAQLLYRCFLELKAFLKPGVTEKEVARRLQILALEKGAEKMAFDPIIAFGKNSAMPHYHPRDVPLQLGDLILIDIGVSLNHYHSDMTRVLFYPPVPQFLMEVYQVVKQAHGAALKECRAGVPVAVLDEAARQVMRTAHMEEQFLHSLGHGIGLETHEFPRLKSRGDDGKIPLESGMAVTVEPGLYFADQGGIRYEDTVLVTPTGYENLYPDMPTEELVLGGA